MTATEHSLLSSYREVLLEHLFAGEVMRHLWISGTKKLEILFQRQHCFDAHGIYKVAA